MEQEIQVPEYREELKHALLQSLVLQLDQALLYLA